MTSLENWGGIPTVEDIDEWHDTGEVGSLYTWCQQMAEELRRLESKNRDGLVRRHVITSDNKPIDVWIIPPDAARYRIGWEQGRPYVDFLKGTCGSV